MSHVPPSPLTPSPVSGLSERDVLLTLFDLGRQVASVIDFEELLQRIPELIGRLKQAGKNSSLDNLSPREFEVLTLLGSGFSLKEVGARIGIDEKTVGTYRARLMTKLHLSTKTDLFRIALESGVIE